MADESHYNSNSNSSLDASANKRKYDDTPQQQQQQQHSSPPRRRATGFSAPIASQPSTDSHVATPASYSSVPPPPVDEIQLAKQRAQEIAARLFNAASTGAGAGEAKRSRVDGGYDSGEAASYGSAYGSGPTTDYGQKAYGFSGATAVQSAPPAYGGYNSGSGKKIEIPNGRVGVIIGKGGETIKYLQQQSGAKIQVQRDAETDIRSNTRLVELTGTPDQVEKAEQLIQDVLKEAEVGGSGTVNRRFNGEPVGEQFAMQIPNNKVGLVIGKGGETIKSMQAQTGARIQIIPLHLPPGDPATERRLQIDGTNEQIEQAKQLVFEVISENRPRNTGMGGGYSQGYQGRPQSSWGHQGGPPVQPTYGEYGQQGGYPAPPAQYNTPQASYGGYPPHPASSGYAQSWDPSSANQGQQAAQGGYDYYNQHNQVQPEAPPAQGDGTGYNYNQQPSSGYSQQGQGYTQDAYGGGYQIQPAYGQQQTGYEQQSSYNTASYAGTAANSTQDAQNAAYGTQADGTQAATTASYASQVTAPDASYGMPPNPGYGNQPESQPSYGQSYGTPQGQKPTSTPPAYGQSLLQSPNTQGGYAQQTGYTLPPPPPPAGYSQADAGPQKGTAPAYNTAGGQTTYAAHPSYGSAPGTQPSYTQQPQYGGAYNSGYSQPPAYTSTEGNGTGNASTPQAAATSTKAEGDASQKA